MLSITCSFAWVCVSPWTETPLMVISASISVSGIDVLSAGSPSPFVPEEQLFNPTARQIKTIRIPIIIRRSFAKSGLWFLLLARLLALVPTDDTRFVDLAPCREKPLFPARDAKIRSELSKRLLLAAPPVLAAEVLEADVWEADALENSVFLPPPFLFLYVSLIPFHP